MAETTAPRSRRKAHKNSKEYLEFQKSFIDHFKPAGAAENREVESIADAAWKLNLSSARQRAILSAPGTADLEELTGKLCKMSAEDERLQRQYYRSVDRLRELQAKRQQSAPALAEFDFSNAFRDTFLEPARPAKTIRR